VAGIGIVVGREPERAQIEQMLEQVPSGPAGVALEGAPGIGKTTLWREAVASARRRGYQVMATAPAEPDAGLAFAGLGDLLDDVPEEIVADLPDPQRRALSVALLAEGDEDAAPDPRALPRAVLSVMRSLSAEGTVLVAIDDEQWLDRASARVLGFALCRLRDEPVGLLLARRPDGGGLLSDELARRFGASGLPVATVGPLDAKSIRDLIAGGNGHAIPRALMRRIQEMSDGNPLYALAIAREIKARPDGGRELPIPRTLEAAIARRLEQLDERAREALLVAAALSHPTVALIHTVLSDFTISDLDGAVSAGIVEVAGERVRFMHPLLASASYSRASGARRREIHRVIAKVIDDEEQRARHLALGAEAPDSAIAGAIEEAAKGAARRGAPDVAADLLENAARLTPGRAAAARRLRLLDAAELYCSGGDGAHAEDLLESLMPELPHGALRGRALCQLAWIRGACDKDAGAALVDEALSEAGDDDRLRLQIESFAAVASSNRGEFAAMLTHSSLALACAERTEDPRLIAEATAQVALAAVFNGQRIDHEALLPAVELTASAPTTGISSAQQALAEILFFVDDYDQGRPALERATQRARDRGEPHEAGRLLFELALLEMFAGDLARAEHHRAAAADAVGDDGLELWLACGEAMFAAARGQLEYARTAAQSALELAEREHDPLIRGHPMIVLASVDLWTGAPHDAHERIHRLRESFTAKGFGFIGAMSIPIWSLDIEALIARGRLDEAQPVVEDLLNRSRTAENPNAIAIAWRCRGLLLAGRGDIPGAIDAMDAALAAHAQRTLRAELARTLLEKGALQRRAKQKSAAKQTLEQALAIFEQTGRRMWADRARDEVSRIGLRRATAGDGLTPAQARVAELVAEGLSNREIANTLYMSTRSVESHLTKVYRELGVRSRAQLAAALARPGGQSPT
jgi:DNA-binding CsgD family transcriptional regulator